METVWQIFYWMGIVTVGLWISVTGPLVTIALYQAIQVLSLIIGKKERDNN